MLRARFERDAARQAVIVATPDELLAQTGTPVFIADGFVSVAREWFALSCLPADFLQAANRAGAVVVRVADTADGAGPETLRAFLPTPRAPATKSLPGGVAPSKTVADAVLVVPRLGDTQLRYVLDAAGVAHSHLCTARGLSNATRLTTTLNELWKQQHRCERCLANPELPIDLVDDYEARATATTAANVSAFVAAIRAMPPVSLAEANAVCDEYIALARSTQHVHHDLAQLALGDVWSAFRLALPPWRERGTDERLHVVSYTTVAGVPESPEARMSWAAHGLVLGSNGRGDHAAGFAPRSEVRAMLAAAAKVEDFGPCYLDEGDDVLRACADASFAARRALAALRAQKLRQLPLTLQDALR